MLAAKNLSTLPLELLCLILTFLECKELLRIRRVCKLLKDIVDSTERLQYLVDMAFFQTMPAKSLDQNPSMYSRRQRLRDRERAWKTLKYRKKMKLPLPDTGAIYEFIGGIYGNATKTNAIHFLELPTLDTPEGEIKVWTHSTLDWTLVDFTFSPDQDLLVVVAASAHDVDHAYNIHLRSLSSGKPHPEASAPELHAVLKQHIALDLYELSGPVKIQVVGDYVVLLCRDIIINGDIGGYMHLWTWKEGHKGYEFVLEFEDGADDFLFLSDDTFLIITVLGTLETYSFADQSRSPHCTGRFGLPELMQDWSYSYAFMSGNPTPGAPPHASHSSTSTTWSETNPFPSHDLVQPTSSDQLLVFFVTVMRESNITDSHSYVFFVKRSALVALDNTDDRRPPSLPSHICTRSASCAASGSACQKLVPWKHWGPSSTRWFSERESSDWQHAVYGFRTIETINEDVLFSRHPRRLRIRDFNPHFERGNDREVEDECRFVMAKDAGREKVTRPFREPLGAGLPYKETVSEEKFEATEVMMDQNRILLLRRNAELDLESIDVLLMG
ncbi:hypothetical protein CONPUDRAFT_75036 [Coniophora puteana RWD-64-598 SS2]|uniref:F-box domain-containing protein n=1 Tax=Coniophora puteana (strain RWD-64-598) TaxID=741705 RepID=A0A5M3MH97_CONPW|nr:uncharacterized protein CONPUDRAFT_75036 [Coniophora puteana RWD-64-598 SS2]EIW78320.1 hypothetical protein CONPUDRAFT_75036 [Coniophora puteana RWD-64-598 SS2]